MNYLLPIILTTIVGAIVGSFLDSAFLFALLAFIKQSVETIILNTQFYRK